MTLRFLLAALVAAAIPSTLADTSTTYALLPSTDVAAQRGPQIFNAVYDSLHKWGCVVHPNGMSLFLATVPEGVLLHHGNTRNATPTAPDWLAYEIEHAEMFARTRGPRGRRPPSEAQEPLADTDMSSSEAEAQHGWLHTYRTIRPLSFLYLDGMSGDKDDSGVADTQDYLLRGVRNSQNKTRTLRSADDKVPGPPGEYDRALDLCDLCAGWGLHGVIRTEGAGFEIIKCDFSDGLQEVQSMQRADNSGQPRRRRDPKGRYGDIGSSRTVLDYSSMVSAFFFPINLTNPDPKHFDLPRLTSTTPNEMNAIRHYLAQVVEARDGIPISPFNHRDIADLVVHRYAAELSLMANDTDSIENMAQRIRFLLEVFIDYSVEEKVLRDTEARDRCSTFYIQTMPRETEVDRLIYAAFKAVNTQICTTLFDIGQMVTNHLDADDALLPEIKDSLKSLKQYLSWDLFE